MNLIELELEQWYQILIRILIRIIAVMPIQREMDPYNHILI